MVIHLTQVDGESSKVNKFGVGVGIEKVLFDPDTDSDPDPDPIHLSEVHNQNAHLRLTGRRGWDNQED